MERKIGLFSFLAFASASSDHGYQSTGLFACWRRYGLFSLASLFAPKADGTRRKARPKATLRRNALALNDVVATIRCQPVERRLLPIRPRHRHVCLLVRAEADVLLLRVHREVAPRREDLAPQAPVVRAVDGDLRADRVA